MPFISTITTTRNEKPRRTLREHDGVWDQADLGLTGAKLEFSSSAGPQQGLPHRRYGPSA